MSRRIVPAALGATALVSALVVGAPAASASCTATDYSPRTVIMGLSPVTKTFGVTTSGCVVQSWTIDLSDSFYVIHSASPQQEFDPNDFYNSAAGLKVDASIETVDETSTQNTNMLPASFVLKRRTSWTTFNAGPEPVSKGKPITITGTLKVADWSAMKYAAQKGSTVSVQFKKAGTSTYTTVKTVVTSSTDGTVKTTVNATYDGTWRLVYGGSGTRGPATSITDYVDVR